MVSEGGTGSVAEQAAREAREALAEAIQRASVARMRAAKTVAAVAAQVRR